MPRKDGTVGIGDTIDFRKLDKVQQGALKRKFPSWFWVPNIAQERATEPWKAAPYRRVQLITFGNGTGKTDYLAEFLCGVVKGPKWVNPKWMDLQFFHDLDAKRKAGTLTVWWVCNGELMKKGAPDYKAILAHIPDAEFKAKTNNGVFREIHIPVVGENKKPIKIVVQVKTHDQSTDAFRGENLDVLIGDEPIPEEHWSEIVGRWRTVKGEVGARVIVGATPLNISAYMHDRLENPENADTYVHTEGSLWENCVGDELPDKIADKLKIRRDPTTGEYVTRGHLTSESIMHQIKEWEQSQDPDEMVARVFGKFSHLQGRIYKVFNRDVHVIKPYPIPPTYPVIQVVDPHDNRPDVAGWYMITPNNKLVCIMEYPQKPYEQITSRNETIAQTCETWRQMEANLGISNQIVKRIADPNRMQAPDSNTGKTKKQLYKKYGGMEFSVNVTDSLEYGHAEVRRFLYYERDKWALFKDDPLYQPRAMFFDTCKNHITFIVKYGTKKVKDPEAPISEKVNQKWKDYPDIFRYAVVTFQPFEATDPNVVMKNDEWESIKAARVGRRHISPARAA
jgi:hypothetical protein